MVSPSKKKSVRAKITNRSRRNAHLLNGQQLPLFKPLANQRFYFHLTGFKNLTEITADIKHLGGEVEEFFSKEVQYVIVPAKPTHSASTSVSPSNGDTSTFSSCNPQKSCVPSPNPTLCTNDPNTPSPLRAGSPDSTNHSINSPTAAASLLSPLPSAAGLSPHPPVDPTRRVTSRAAALLVRARFRQPGTTDVISNAKRWGAQVWSITKLQNYLAELASHPSYKARSNSQKRSGSASSVSGSKSSVSARQLAHPNSLKVSSSKKPENDEAGSNKPSSKSRKAYIKLEDFARKYRPLFKEISNWPVINVETPRTTCPFAEAPPLSRSASSKSCTPRGKKRNGGEGADSPKALDARTPHKQEDDTGSFATPNRTRAKDGLFSTPQAAVRGASQNRRKSGGYCELCQLQYTSLHTHLLSTSHKSFVTDASNYGELDQLIREVHDQQQAKASLYEQRALSQNTCEASPDASLSSHHPHTAVAPPTLSQQP